MRILHFDSMGLIKISLGDLSGANDFLFLGNTILLQLIKLSFTNSWYLQFIILH